MRFAILHMEVIPTIGMVTARWFFYVSQSQIEYCEMGPAVLIRED